MCTDAPCIPVCPEGVLLHDRGMKMGEARINILNCLAHQGTFCSTCVEQCPVDGAMRLEDGKPIINSTACTGCGVCQYMCPAPVNPLMILARQT